MNISTFGFGLLDVCKLDRKVDRKLNCKLDRKFRKLDRKIDRKSANSANLRSKKIFEVAVLHLRWKNKLKFADLCLRMVLPEFAVFAVAEVEFSLRCPALLLPIFKPYGGKMLLWPLIKFFYNYNEGSKPVLQYCQDY